jgi:hypothetical protein
MAFDRAMGGVVLFGGCSGACTAGRKDRWLFDGANWTQITTSTTPTARSGHMMAYDAARRELVVFGGQTSPSARLADTWVLRQVASSTSVQVSTARQLAGAWSDPTVSAIALAGDVSSCESVSRNVATAIALDGAGHAIRAGAPGRCWGSLLIQNSTGSVTLTDVTLANAVFDPACYCANYGSGGSAVEASNAVVTATSTSFSNNNSLDLAAGIDAQSATINTASFTGDGSLFPFDPSEPAAFGPADVTTTGDANITGTSFTNVGSGTADVVAGGTATISSSTFKNGQDGGIAAQTIMLSGSTINGLGIADVHYPSFALTASSGSISNSQITNSTGVRLDDGDISASTFTNNGPFAALSGQSFTIEQSTFASNASVNAAVFGGTVSVDNSTFANNDATGGFFGDQGSGDSAIYAQTSITATNSTFTGNAADSGCQCDGSGAPITAPSVTLNDSTVANNATTTDGTSFSAQVSAVSLSITASVVANAGTGRDCQVTGSTSATYGYDDDGSCALTGATNTSDGPDPQLAALANNGGPTQTMLPQSGSPLIDAVPSASCSVNADQRGYSRPQGAGCDIGSVEVIPAKLPVASIGDATFYEGDSGSHIEHLAVTLDHPTTSTVTVGYSIFRGPSDTATPGSDFTATTGTLTLTPNLSGLTATSTFIPVTILGDTTTEANETFTVALTSATEATIGRASTRPTILNDDPGTGLRITVSNAGIVEGNSVATPGGSNAIRFHVTLSNAVPTGHANVVVKYTVTGNTATGGSGPGPGIDFINVTSPVALTFSPGQNDKTITVRTFADTTIEPNETFSVNLTSVSGGATIMNGVGVGTIINDD